MKTQEKNFITLLKDLLKKFNENKHITDCENEFLTDISDNTLHMLYPKSEESPDTLSQDEILTFAATFSVPNDERKVEAWEKLSMRIDATEKIITLPKTPRKLIRYGISIAASILLLISTTIFILNQNTTIICAKGQHLTYILPDSSEIMMNSETQIKFSKSRYRWNRKIELTGEAIFKVKKGKPFEVQTQNSIITVLGTSFNVYSRGEELKVTCMTGKVMVSLPAQKVSKTLFPNYKTEKIKGGGLSAPLKFDQEEGPVWQKGKFAYRQKPLLYVLDEIGRQFNVRIECKGCENRTYTGHFYNNNLTEALTMVCEPMQLNFIIKNNNTVLLNPKTN